MWTRDRHRGSADGREQSASGGDYPGAEAVGEKAGEKLSSRVGEAEDEDEIGEVEGLIVIEARHQGHDDGEIFPAEIIRRVEDPGGQEYRSEERRVWKECRSRWSPNN